MSFAEWFQRYKEDITWWLALVSFLMSLCSWFFTLWNKRVNLEILPDKDGQGFVVSDVKLIKGNIDGEQTAIAIYLPCFYINHSGCPVSITQIIFTGENKKEYRVTLAPAFSFYTFKKMLDTDSIYERFSETTAFPLNLDALQAEHSPFLLLVPYNAKLQDAKIMTNRKTVRDKKLALFVQSIIDEKCKVADKG